MTVFRNLISACCLIGYLLPAAHAMSREECMRQEDENQMIRCVEQKIFDPCEFNDGSWGKGSWMISRCASVHLAIADKKLSALEAEIKSRLSLAKRNKTRAAFDQSQAKWRDFRTTYCNFTNLADESKAFPGAMFDHLSSGFCERRLTEQRVTELLNYFGEARNISNPTLQGTLRDKAAQRP